MALGKLGGYFVYDTKSKVKFGVSLKKNTQNDKLSGVLGAVYKACDKTTFKGKINQNLKASFSVKHKLHSNVTGNFGFSISQDTVPFVKGKPTRLPLGFSFDINI